MGFEEIVQMYWPIFGIMGLAIVGSVIYNIYYFKKLKGDKANFLSEHPDASKIFLVNKAVMTQEAVAIHTVDGDTPIKMLEKGKPGFYVAPGDRVVEISYSYTRPGIMYKNVTKSTGVVKKELTIEPNKSYTLGFDRKEEEFTFEEN